MVASSKQPKQDEATAAIVRGERLRIAAELRKAVSDAVPEEPMAYIQGFRDGADFVAERLLGLLVSDAEPQG